MGVSDYLAWAGLFVGGVAARFQRIGSFAAPSLVGLSHALLPGQLPQALVEAAD